MNDWIRHGWKLVALVIILGVVGRMDYEHEKRDEAYMKAYYEDIQKRSSPTHTASHSFLNNEQVSVADE